MLTQIHTVHVCVWLEVSVNRGTPADADIGVVGGGSKVKELL